MESVKTPKIPIYFFFKEKQEKSIKHLGVENDLMKFTKIHS